MDLLELPIQTQDRNWLCGAAGKTVWWLENEPYNIVEFVLWNLLSASTKLNLSKNDSIFF